MGKRLLSVKNYCLKLIFHVLIKVYSLIYYMSQNSTLETVTQQVSAQENPVNSFSEILSSMGPIIIIILIFYFLLIRPQQKKMRAHQEMIQNLKKGDQVWTAGGVLAKVVKVDNKADTVKLEIAKDVQVEAKKHTISEVLNTKK